MSVARCVLNSAVMHLLRIGLELLGGIVACKTEVKQVNLLIASLSESKENIGAFDVGVNVFAAVNVFKCVDLKLKIMNKQKIDIIACTHKLPPEPINGVQRKQPVVLKKDLPNVATEPRHHHKPMLERLNLMRTAGDILRHAQSL